MLLTAMATSFITSHISKGHDWGWIVMFAFASFSAVRSCFADVFIDESESGVSEEERETHGLKATKTTRPIMVTLFTAIAAFSIWKIWHP